MALSDRELDDVVRRAHAEVSDARAARLRADAEAGRPAMDADDLRQLTQALLGMVFDRLARERIEQGLGPIEATDEQRVGAAVQSMGRLGWVIEELMADPEVENIDINGPDVCFVSRADGSKTLLPHPIARNNDELERWVRNAAARVGLSERRFDEGRPHLILRLPDGSRLFACMSVTQDVHISIRVHRHPRVTLDELVEGGMMSPELGEFHRALVLGRFNLIVTGETNAGKTTLVRALLNEAPPEERLITVEDSYELGLDRLGDRHPDVVSLEAREANVEGAGEITMADLVRMGLRMNPTRVIVGEVRGPELVPMLQAMTQGSDGSMATVHSDSSGGAFQRLAMYAICAPEHLEPPHTALLVAQAVDFIIHISHVRERRGNRRFISSVREVTGAHERGIETNEVFAPGPDGIASSAGAHPLSQRSLDRLARVGWHLPTAEPSLRPVRAAGRRSAR